MKNIVVDKIELRKFIKESIINFNYVLNANDAVEEKIENENISGSTEQEIYLLGIDEDGTLIYTESSLYIPFSNAVFFEILDENYLKNNELENTPYSSEKDLSYFKNLIEAKFKNKGIDVSISFK
jgi:hypothetical protein